MQYFDVFNGDADGLCALVQLRLAEPRPSTLITGVKRDTALLKQIPTDQPASITALDISLDKNRAAVDQLLQQGSQVFYADHHYPGETLPEHPAFKSLIDTDALTCTSLIIDKSLNGAFHLWAIVAAFGDNLVSVAEQLCQAAGLSEQEAEALKTLGICLNYNGYGATTGDLLFHPAELFHALVKYKSPLDFIKQESEMWHRLHKGYEQDMEEGLNTPAFVDEPGVFMVCLPDAAWARRVNGVLGNALANARPDQAVAVLNVADDAHYGVSIRAPLNNRSGADEVVRQFPTGGGRKAAAGINKLPLGQREQLLLAMESQWFSAAAKVAVKAAVIANATTEGMPE